MFLRVLGRPLGCAPGRRVPRFVGGLRGSAGNLVVEERAWSGERAPGGVLPGERVPPFEARSGVSPVVRARSWAHVFERAF